MVLITPGRGRANGRKQHGSHLHAEPRLKRMLATRRLSCTRSFSAAWSAASCAHLYTPLRRHQNRDEGRDAFLFERVAAPDLPFWTGTRPRVVSVSPSIVSHFYTPSARRRREPIPRLSRYGRLKSEHLWGGSTASSLAIVHFGSVGRLWGLFERSNKSHLGAYWTPPI